MALVTPPRVSPDLWFGLGCALALELALGLVVALVARAAGVL